MTRLSAIEGPPLSDEPGLGPLTMPGFIDELAQRYPKREALCWRDLGGLTRCWTFAQMQAECRRVARALLASGVGKGARVGVLVSNRPEWVFSVFGASMVGAVVVALNTFSTREELRQHLRQADVQFLILERHVAAHDFVADLQALCPELALGTDTELLSDVLPFLRGVICLDDRGAAPGMLAWSDFIARGARVSEALAAAAQANVSPMDLSFVFFSSGSTATPKAIQQTQRAAALQCWRFGKWYDADQSIRSWSSNGLFWSGNFAMAFGALSLGGSLVLQRLFDADEALALIQAERVNHILAWPHQQARLKECAGWESADLSALKFVDENSVFASHPSVRTTWRQIDGYGLTETFTFVTGISSTQNTRGSNGFVLPGNMLRIIDSETGAVMPVGETGEIIVKGPTLTPGYLNIPPEEIFDSEGFFHTADAGYVSEDGHLYWKGRISDIIKTGGANVSPLEIDEVLARHPLIQTTATVGVPDDLLGELVISCVLLREGAVLDEAAVRGYAREKLSSYKVPRRVLFVSAQDMPVTTGSAKVRRAELRALAMAWLAAALQKD